MTKVKKRSGELEEFDRTKIAASMKRAGADDQVARTVAEKTTVEEGTPTMEIRKRVAEELRKVNERIAEAYERTLRLRVKARDDVSMGAARVPKEIKRVPDVRRGLPARVRHRDNRKDVLVEPMLDEREVWLNRKELETLGAQEGTRVAVRFLREGGGGPTPMTETRQQQPTTPMRPRGG